MESPHSYSPAHEHSTFDGHQPVPQQAVQSMPLDLSYLSNVSPSDSLSSSLGAATFGDGLLDPTVFGSRGRGSAYSSDISYGGHGLASQVQPKDPVADPRVPFSNRAPGRATSLDTFGHYNKGTPWLTGLSPMNQGFSMNEQHPFTNGYSSITLNMIGPNIPMTQVHRFNQEPFNDAPYNDMGSISSHQHPPFAKQVIEANGIMFSNGMINGLSKSQYNSPTRSQYSQLSASFPPSVQHQAVSPIGEVLMQPSVSPHVSHPPTSAILLEDDKLQDCQVYGEEYTQTSSWLKLKQ
ncbi:hypothetical protein F5J12DRAFT_951420 [Pisolithus orientalis]|uniref:uncharacterized protein n=1 Tax=Pisolithus orientalis TaxID=936130 RepID=UPI002224D80B|nr:uncharacterized protein F5J12DRAFT_951420 [Pisolithus orientalis]KAI6000210.1 hypothetical protein F5J12DRAFT_951420 [Pisolithus orientalis]